MKLVDIGPQDVLDGNETRVLGLLWSIISVFSIRSVNLTMPGVRHMGDLKSRLILWGQKNAEAKSSEGCEVPSSIMDVADGRVLLAILHGAAPNRAPYSPERTASATLRKAVRLAQALFGVAPMIDPEANPNARNIEKIVVMYLTELYLALPNVGKGVNTDSPSARSRSGATGTYASESLVESSGYNASGGGMSPGTDSNSPALGRAALHASTLANAGSPSLEGRATAAWWRRRRRRRRGHWGPHTAHEHERANAELEGDALRQRCYELEHAANALPATLEKMRELQAYTKQLAEQYGRRSRTSNRNSR